MKEKELPAKCRTCKKAPKNCDCVEFVLRPTERGMVVLADNIATEPVRGQESRTWQPRANARVWRSPTYVDGYPVLYLTDETLLDRVKAEIKAGSFNPFDYEEVGGANVPRFHKDLVRRFAFLRRARQRSRNSARAEAA
jgi:hypothetical protein